MAVRKGISLHFLAIFICLGLTLFACSCFSQTSRKDSTNCVEQDQSQDYPCPGCGRQIPMENINTNIRTENKCSSCGKIFFGKPVVESGKVKNYQQGYGSYGPRNYGPTSTYQSDVSYQRFGIGGYSFKETPYGFSELSWNFYDSKVKSYRVIPRWTTTRYHYP